MSTGTGDDDDSRAITSPIVVPNTLWQAADPLAYDGGRESDITHLREFEASGLGRRDDALKDYGTNGDLANGKGTRFRVFLNGWWSWFGRDSKGLCPGFG